MRYFDGPELQGIFTATVKSGLVFQRAALLAGIDIAWIAGIPTSEIPLSQLNLDLEALNRRNAVLPNPFETWLRNATQLAGAQAAAAIFEQRADALVTSIAAAQSLAMPSKKVLATGLAASLPSEYLDALSTAMAGLRPGPAFALEDCVLLFGNDAPPHFVPESTSRADCAVFLKSLDLVMIDRLATNLFTLELRQRQSIRAYVQFELIARGESLAGFDRPVIVNRSALLTHLRQLRGPNGQRMLRVTGLRGTGLSFTKHLIVHLVGTAAGSDQRMIAIDLGGYTTRPMVGAVEDIIRRGNINGLPPSGRNVAPAKHIEELAEFVIDGLTVRDERTWLVFDRCGVVAESAELADFLARIAGEVVLRARDPRCPRVVFLEADDRVFRPYKRDILVEVLAPINDDDFRAFFAARGLPETRSTQLIEELSGILAGLEGFERLQEMQRQLEDWLFPAGVAAAAASTT